MDLYVFNPDFTPAGLVDTYKSLIWTDRFDECGDFELHVPATRKNVEVLNLDNIVVSGFSGHGMFVEEVHISSDAQEGSTMMVKGRSLESLLYRRIAWGQTIMSGDLQTAIHKLIDDAFISPDHPDRHVGNFIFKETTDAEIKKLVVNAQYYGESLGDIIFSLCKDAGIGCSITLNDKREFIFSLYNGVDHSYADGVNKLVIFSPQFDNIFNSEFTASITNFKNVTLIGGEDNGAARLYASVGKGTGLTRREVFTDANSVSTNGEGGAIPDSEYKLQLINAGYKTLSEHSAESSFDGEADTFSQFRYGRDFTLGDFVRTENTYGSSVRSQVVEYIFSDDTNGTSSYPKFKVVE